MDFLFEDRLAIPRCLRLAFSLEDTSMTSVRAAGISGIMLSVGFLEVVTMSTIFPITGERSTPKLTPVQESTPEPASVQEFTSELAPIQESVSEPAPLQDFVFEFTLEPAQPMRLCLNLLKSKFQPYSTVYSNQRICFRVQSCPRFNSSSQTT